MKNYIAAAGLAFTVGACETPASTQEACVGLVPSRTEIVSMEPIMPYGKCAEDTSRRHCIEKIDQIRELLMEICMTNKTGANYECEPRGTDSFNCNFFN